ncbi:phospholipase D-like domain-containing protein [Pseudobacteriovorax antillogorgiicola]|uniref:Phosphatidylserine/phosphatidylglycerophosphate/cardiolipin synthase n=1 Tax=Pseudobacteriovorax antillogorgiicola TaxID=1513793 RepID=A0A1Y6BPG5_9BACT|nr:phospholipase D-like domain-containing protein [Pseudobacteriovorax antillogorgiicola]TCS55376.1 phosphatidylserine/phosphatidylglycerophosphate/cardiolipin synthase-like enzyme [Pseudobacteriovorax antillogorgiicola]SMF13363.1 Phosphatidylserine/phosphatidylglycerophosphate/cardiolipin synthase [Pseudobacteriovorax antillogorgiicola]
MKRSIFSSLILLASAFSCVTPQSSDVPQSGERSLVLVESYPFESGLDEPDIAKTSDVWIEMVKQSKAQIDIMQQYANIITNRSPSMDKFLAELKKAHKRGVRVRILLGEHMIPRSETIAASVDLLKSIPGFEVRVTDRWKGSDGILHAKFMTVDRRTAYLGSANMDWKALDHIKELGFKIQEPHLVKSLQAVFEDDWKNFDKKDNIVQNLPKNLSQSVDCSWSLNPCQAFLAVSPGGMGIDSSQWELTYLLEYIASAETTIDIATYRYKQIFWGKERKFLEIEHALEKALAKGVQVRLLLDPRHKPEYFTNLLARGAEIKTVSFPDHSSGPMTYARLVHAKYLVVDHKKIWMGTSNFSGGYFYFGRNIGIFVESKEIANKVSHIFKKYWNSSYSQVVEPSSHAAH